MRMSKLLIYSDVVASLDSMLSLGMNNISKLVLLSCDEHCNGNVFLLFIPSISNLFKNKMSGQN
jgi:hypothetical protein